jgi:hypothetical protein
MSRIRGEEIASRTLYSGRKHVLADDLSPMMEWSIGQHPAPAVKLPPSILTALSTT